MYCRKYTVTRIPGKFYDMTSIPSPTTTTVLSRQLAAPRLDPALDIVVLLATTEELVAPIEQLVRVIKSRTCQINP